MKSPSIRDLGPDELDAVCGGLKMVDLKVAGLHIKSYYDPETRTTTTDAKIVATGETYTVMHGQPQ